MAGIAAQMTAIAGGGTSAASAAIRKAGLIHRRQEELDRHAYQLSELKRRLWEAR
jgi:hypothetical protein